MRFGQDKPKASVSQSIYRALRAQIVSLERKPGEVLREKDLTAEFGVSRVALREAIQRLDDGALVDVLPQRGTYVAPIRQQSVMCAHFLRMSLEIQVARTLTQGEFKHATELQQLLRAQISCLDTEEDLFLKLDEEFHDRLLELSGYGELKNTLSVGRAHIDRVRKLSVRVPGHSQRVVKEHRAILTAIESRDAKKAEASIRSHLEPFSKIVETVRESHPDYFEAGEEFNIAPALGPRTSIK